MTGDSPGRLLRLWIVTLILIVSTVKPAFVQDASEATEVVCPSVLGTGLTTQREFCDILIGRDPQVGVRVVIPRQSGEAQLSFDLSNRHTYSEEQALAGLAFAQYTATIGVLTSDGTLLSRGVIQSEFRSIEDLVDRVGGGAGPGGVKAVAPTGLVRIEVNIPSQVDSVAILGEILEVRRLDGHDIFTSTGRPIAIISNVEVSYLAR